MSNIYDPPSSSLEDEPGAGGDGLQKFYVVERQKLLLLYIFTFGLYKIYWFYKNWSNFKVFTRESLWPVPRSIFTIFFVHSLLREVQSTIEGENREYRWNHGAIATCYVIAQITVSIMDRLPNRIDWIVIPLELGVMLPLIGFLLYRAQGAINVACGDPKGTSNTRLSWANYAWMAIGFLILILALAGFAADLFGEPSSSNV